MTDFTVVSGYVESELKRLEQNVAALIEERDALAAIISNHNEQLATNCERKRERKHCMWKKGDPYICGMCDRNYLIDAARQGENNEF